MTIASEVKKALRQVGVYTYSVGIWWFHEIYPVSQFVMEQAIEGFVSDKDDWMVKEQSIK